MSLFNPGKRGILTLLSVVLIIGIPGIIAYSDSSDDTYLSHIDTNGIDYITVYDGVIGSNKSFETTCVENDVVYTVSVPDESTDSTSRDSLTSVTSVQIYLKATAFEDITSKIVFDSDFEETAVDFILLNSTNTVLGTFSMEYNSDASRWEVDITSTDLAAISGATKAKFTVAVEAAALPSEFDVTFGVYEIATIFTNDVVELIVLVGGIALLIIGTFSLSFIDLDTPGKAANSFIRGAKSAGRKVANYGRKKR